jgi:dTDP-4-amino-4,6-dideoxygalactose transaminase
MDRRNKEDVPLEPLSKWFCRNDPKDSRALEMTSRPKPMLVSADHCWSWTTLSIRRTQDEPASNSRTQQYSFFWARNAIYHALRLLDIKPGDHVLLPAYICRAAVDPFIAFGLDVDFYSIDRSCNALFDDIIARVTARTRAILLVHYFGFPQEVRQIRQLCDRHRAVLIEDCAHVLSGDVDGQPMGTFGDAAVFSWRKFLPVFDGSELIINRPSQTETIEFAKETPLFTLKVALNLLDQSMRNTKRLSVRTVYSGFRVLENALRICVNRYVDKSPVLSIESTSAQFDERSLHLPMSRMSRWIRRHANVQEIVAQRRHNYEILRNELRSSKVIPLFPTLPASVCPWVFPAFFDGIPEAHRILRKRGIPANAWDSVRHPGVRFGAHKDADFLYQNLVFLPIHQSVHDEDMVKIAAVAKSL